MLWLFGLCVALLISGALLCLLLPLLKPSAPKALRVLEQAWQAGIVDEQQYAAKREQLLERFPATARPPKAFSVLMLLAVPAAAMILYYQIGNPEALDPERRAAITSPAQGVQQLQQALENHPDDLEGWLLLGNTLSEQQRFSDAVGAYQQALSLIPADRPERAVVMTDIAEAMIFASNSQRVPDDARTYLEQAMTIDPQSQRALWLLGVVAFQDQDFALAIQRWQTLLPLLESPTVTQSVREQIAQAQARLEGRPDPEISPDSAAQSATGSSGIAVRISLDETLAAQLAGQAGPPVLFVFARVSGSQQPPVAIQRLPLSNMPITVILTNEDAMLPGNSLGTLNPDTELDVTARISFSGNAIAQPGDWEGQATTTLGGGQTVLPLTIKEIVTN